MTPFYVVYTKPSRVRYRVADVNGKKEGRASVSVMHGQAEIAEVKKLSKKFMVRVRSYLKEDEGKDPILEGQFLKIKRRKSHWQWKIILRVTKATNWKEWGAIQ